MNTVSPPDYFQINSTFVNLQDHQEDFEDPGPIVHEEFGKDVIENNDKIYIFIFYFVVKSESDRLKSLLLTLFDFFNNAQFVLIATPISWVKGDKIGSLIQSL